MQQWIRRATLGAALTFLLAACGGGGLEEGGSSSGGGQAAPAPKDVTVRLASNDFTEQLILGEIYKQSLEKAGYTVDYKARLGSREVVAPALESGQIDMYVEYTGSALSILAGKGDLTDPEQIYDELKAYYATKGITPLERTPMSDQNALAVTRETAQKHGITTISDLAKVADQLVLGGPPECEQRPTCLKGVQDAYGTKFKSFRPLQGPIRYQALTQGQVQVAVVFTTEGAIARNNLLVVEDDKRVFPPDQGVPVVRDDFLAKAGPDFTTLVNKVSAAITTEEITKLNAKVDLDKEDPDDVAKQWLTEKGLI